MRGASGRHDAVTAIAVLLAIGLSACADAQLPRLSELNPFAEKEVPLPGKRVPVGLADSKAGLEVSSIDRPIALPAPAANDGWSQPGGTASNSPGHLVLSATPRQVWSASAGTGSTSYGRLTASPIVVGGKILTLDTKGAVTAFSAGGGVAWRVSLTPEKQEATKGFGGGLASDGARVYAATGYGIVYALDAQSGKRIWEKNVGGPMRASPTATADKVVVLTSDGFVVALATADGAELWRHQGLPEKQAILANPSPAIEGDLVVVPFPSGDLVALRASTGQPAWSESLARTRLASSLGSMTDVARPVIDAGTVFAVGHSGRMVATISRSGERLWSLSVPGFQQPAVVGEMVYVVDTTGQLMGITRRDGKIVWTAKLPDANTWSGPVAAGGKLWLTSNKGGLVGVEATTGKVDTKIGLGDPCYIAPVVAGGRMYVLTDNAKLIALQ